LYTIKIKLLGFSRNDSKATCLVASLQKIERKDKVSTQDKYSMRECNVYNGKSDTTHKDIEYGFIN